MTIKFGKISILIFCNPFYRLRYRQQRKLNSLRREKNDELNQRMAGVYVGTDL